MRSYTEAKAYLEAGRGIPRDSRPLSGRATELVRRGPDRIAVCYHATDVVTYHADGTCTLDSGGWRTATTKARMNEYSPAIVSQTNGLWYVGGRPWMGEPVHLYVDGVRVDATGKVLNPPHPRTVGAMEIAKRKVDRLVSAYVRGYVRHLEKIGHLPEPEAGDCWYCYMRPNQDTSQSLGDATGNVDHLLSHFGERYYVPSLLYNAVIEMGYNDPPYILNLIDSDLRRERPSYGGPKSYHVGHALRRYLGARKLALAEALLPQCLGEVRGRTD